MEKIKLFYRFTYEEALKDTNNYIVIVNSCYQKVDWELLFAKLKGLIKFFSKY